MDKVGKVDIDGMPIAPDGMNIDDIILPAMSRANSWHLPSRIECLAIQQILLNFYKSTIDGPAETTTQSILEAATHLGLKVCRIKNYKIVVEKGITKKVPDSYLFFYSGPGVKNYSGAFMLLRETRHSKVIIISPHDDSDNTRIATKIAFTESYALAMISNGHKRSSVGLPHRDTDFCHNSPDKNLATYTVALLCKIFSNHVVLHFHGFVKNRECMVNARHKELGSVFKESVAKYTRLDPNSFVALQVFFTLDKLVNTSFYLKTEMPVSIYQNNKVILRNVVLDIEKKDWAWYNPTDQLTIEKWIETVQALTDSNEKEAVE